MFKDSCCGRCQSGVPGLDAVLGGGFQRGGSVVVRGGIGTGKTVLAAQFLHNGAVQCGEPGVLMILEEGAANYKKDMLRFGLDMGRLQDAGMLIMLDKPFCSSYLEKRTATIRPDERNFFGMSDLVDLIIESARKINAKRVVIDNLPAVSGLLKYGEYARQVILYLNDRLQREGLTSLIISDDMHEKYDAVADYLCDGVVCLVYRTGELDAGRRMYVKKMKGAKNSLDEHPLLLEEGTGMRVEP